MKKIICNICQDKGYTEHEPYEPDDELIKVKCKSVKKTGKSKRRMTFVQILINYEHKRFIFCQRSRTRNRKTGEQERLDNSLNTCNPSNKLLNS